MKVDRRYYCFGCGATGDGIDFVSLLHGISGKGGRPLLAWIFSIPRWDGIWTHPASLPKNLRQ